MSLGTSVIPEWRISSPTPPGEQTCSVWRLGLHNCTHEEEDKDISGSLSDCSLKVWLWCGSVDGREESVGEKLIKPGLEGLGG